MTANHPTTLVDWLDDLTVRFLLNLPPTELSSVPRLCFQVEEAQWYYEDFVRPAIAASGLPPLPSLPLRQFCLLLFQHCPLLSGFTDAQHIAAYEEFLAYKVRVPVRGAIMLNEAMDKVLLVRGWKKGASWSFPRGKINKDEKDIDCAVREVYEETGYDARSAGVVPDNEDEVKFIDITMREQHMRLFVFRGVAESTHFEPKTRKEIGAIQWYSIKDLPGFKKHKSGQENDGMSANKFYMVAPFLGHLKKWIGQQRKLDKSRATQAMQLTTDDQGDYEEEQTTDVSIPVDSKSEDLKRLLSIGQAPQAAALSPPTEQANAQANNLLAMLQGTTKPSNSTPLPHTPFEQINAFPPQPKTPQPNHLRDSSLSQQYHQPPPPTFPLSPQSSYQQEHQRQQPLPTPNIFGPGPNGFPPGQSHVHTNTAPQHHGQQQFEQTHGMPPVAPPRSILHSDRLPFDGLPQSQRPPPQPSFQGPYPPQVMWPHSPPPNAFMAQGPQGAIGSGPSVPSASQLPAPRLNAQSIKLLDAFKSASQQPSALNAPGVARTQPRATSLHQTALLDLFKKPSASSASDLNIPEPEAPASPTGTDVTEKPPKALERRPTLNEITRTLPTKMKVKSPPTAPTAHTPQSGAVKELERPTPKSRELYDPSAPIKPAPVNKALNGQQQHSSVLHSPKTRQGTRSPKGGRASPAASSSTNGKGSINQPIAAPITILARPGSAKGPKSPAPPSSPLRNEGQKAPFQPQVLKRPQATSAVESDDRPADKKDQLLALFGKTASTTAPSNEQPKAADPASTPQAQTTDMDASKQKNALLGLFNTTRSPLPGPTSSSTPPPAPRIVPERSPSGHSAATPRTVLQHPVAPAPRSQQSSLLLDLFHNQNVKQPQSHLTSGQQSPGTPISPFTLGTPVVSSLDGLARSRVGSVVSTMSPDGSVRSPTTETPQQKEFLKGLLNEVVRKEGI